MPDPPAPTRRGAIDVARSAALVLVVLGHLTMAVIDRGADGAVRGANLLALEPGIAWLAMLAPMPVFFAAAGWANATATTATAASRLRTLVGLGAVVVVAWSTLSIGELLVRGEGGVVADGARISTQPLWFLAAYVPFTALGARLAHMATRPVLAIGGSLVVLAALDLARFGFDAPEVVGWPGFFLAWGVPWVLGAWWRSRWEAGGLREVRTGLALAIGALAAATGLVVLAGYSPALIDAVPGKRSNTTPPGLYTATAAMVQVGLLMVLAQRLDGLAIRRRRLLDQAGTASVGIYAWHLTALSLCAAAIAAGLWAPRRFGAGWWLSRPVWFAAVLGLTGGLVALTATARAELRRRGSQSTPHRALGQLSVVAGVICTTVGAGVIGLRGPRTLPGATVSIVAFVAGWWLLRAAGTRDPDQGAATSTAV